MPSASTSERHLGDNSSVIRVTIIEDYVPNVFVQVDLVGETLRRNGKGEKVSSM